MNTFTGIFQGLLPQIYLVTFRNTCFSVQLFSKNIYSDCLLHIHLYNSAFSISSCIVISGLVFLLKCYKAPPTKKKIFQERKNHGKTKSLGDNKKQPPEVFCKKGVLRNFAKFTGKHLCQILFFNKVAGLRPETLFKTRLWHRCFPVNIAKFQRTPFFIEGLWWVLLDNQDSWGKISLIIVKIMSQGIVLKGQRADSQGAKIWFDEIVFVLINIQYNFKQLYNFKPWQGTATVLGKKDSKERRNKLAEKQLY